MKLGGCRIYWLVVTNQSDDFSLSEKSEQKHRTEMLSFIFSPAAIISIRGHSITHFRGNERIQMCGNFEGFPL